MSNDQDDMARTANLLGALALAVSDRLVDAVRFHPKQTDSAPAALHLIGSFPGCSNNELSRALNLSHSATVRLVDRLEESGLVAASREKDGRTTSLHLSEAGSELVRSLAQKRRDCLTQFVQPLSAAEQKSLKKCIEKLLQSMKITPFNAATICRLCCELDCPPHLCPVHRDLKET